MPPIAVSVGGVGKRYRIGKRKAAYATLREALVDSLAGPVRRAMGNRTEGGDRDIVWALRDVSFEINEGEVVGVIGRNGAGKSTLLKILARITPPTTGEIRIRGRVGALLEVGTGFHPELTGRENIFLNGVILGMSRAEIRNRFDEIVAFAEVERFLDTQVKHYSSGMYARLGFAVAAHLEPEVLLVDEALAVGDSAFQAKCLGKIRDVALGGRTILLVSHNMTTLVHVCKRALLLDQGELRAQGPIETVIAQYRASLSMVSGESLAERSDRKGEGGVLLTKVELRDAEGRPASTLISGDPVEIVLDYVAERDFEHLDFAVSFNTLTSMPLFLCSSTHSVPGAAVSRRPGRVVCRIQALPLAQGTYIVNAAAFLGATIYDWVGTALTVDVETLDFYGTGHAIPAGHSPFLVRSAWAYVTP